MQFRILPRFRGEYREGFIDFLNFRQFPSDGFLYVFCGLNVISNYNDFGLYFLKKAYDGRDIFDWRFLPYTRPIYGGLIVFWLMVYFLLFPSDDGLLFSIGYSDRNNCFAYFLDEKL